MRLDEREADLIRESFRGVAADPVRAAEIFYRRLFEAAPQVRPLFVGDLARQGQMLISTLGVVVAQMQRWDVLAPMVEDLALRHVAYGVQADHYPVVGGALVAMLHDMARPALAAETEAAWAKAYAALSSSMIAAAYGPAAGDGVATRTGG